MRLNKLTFLLCVAGINITSFSQSTVYKCEDAKGVISYLNEPQNGYTCQKTELGSIKNMATIKNEGSLPKSVSSPEKIKDFNEKISSPSKPNDADLKRLMILTKELEEEKKQVTTMSNMLNNIDDKNNSDAKRLKDILDGHKRNVDSLEGQIAKINPQPLTAKIGNNNLPIGIPKTEMTQAIMEGKKLGNINSLPTNQLVVDRVAVTPTAVAANDIKANYALQIENAKSAEDAVRMSNLALENARKQLEEFEKKASDAKELYEREQFEKQVRLAKDNLKKQEENNQKIKGDVLKAEDELLVIMKRQNLLMEERSYLWKKKQELQEKMNAKKVALLKEEEEKKKEQQEYERMTTAKEKLLQKNKILAEQKINILMEKKNMIEAQNKEIEKKKDLIDKNIDAIKKIT